jgi:hypothetical protein
VVSVMAVVFEVTLDLTCIRAVYPVKLYGLRAESVQVIERENVAPWSQDML